jgi:predicted metal-dependent phosphoesterase TrpH
MRHKIEPLLCELHAHTTWSDGLLGVRELADLYGRSGFDVLCITDHVLRTDDPWHPHAHVTEERQSAYLAELESEAARALRRYGLLVLPGLELTYNDSDPLLSAHAVAIGCRSFVAVDEGIERAMTTARREGAAIIAAHPYRTRTASARPRATLRFARDWRTLAPFVDRWELFNRLELYGWVAHRGLPAVATGDFHRHEHLAGWKTLLPCTKDEEAVVGYLRSERPAFLARVESHIATLAA